MLLFNDDYYERKPASEELLKCFVFCRNDVGKCFFYVLEVFSNCSRITIYNFEMSTYSHALSNIAFSKWFFFTLCAFSLFGFEFIFIVVRKHREQFIYVL
jgi:hypothetical protein